MKQSWVRIVKRASEAGTGTAPRPTATSETDHTSANASGHTLPSIGDVLGLQFVVRDYVPDGEAWLVQGDGRILRIYGLAEQ